ncbi:MAG: FAD-dependent oxidoreductase [Dehalococcoidia bacterium]|nr:FAD-dependent oxidoreductase [Dehalococcoidia bacterium]
MIKEYKRVTVADNCMGCFACEVACKQEHNLPVGPRWIRAFPDIRETGGRWWFTYLVTECHRAATPPCRVACPAELNIWKYVNLAAVGRFEEALEVVRETTPFAGVLGYVCTRPCESSCERGNIDIPVAIRAIKAFLADYEIKAGRKKAKPVKKTKKDKVAIIGAGAAGLSCAYDLIRHGYPVTVLEASSKAGGLMCWGIPEFRLPRNIVDNEISYIEELGVEIKTNTPVKALDDLFKQGYKAIYLATGCPVNLKLGIPNEDAKGIIYVLDFLKQVSSGADVKLGSRVAVIGGGNAAIDAARVSKRQGAKEVHLVCLETRDLTSKDRMPAQDYEIHEAEKEGVVIHPSLGPKRFLVKDGKVTGFETMVCTSVREEDGTFLPKYGGSAATIDADTVIVAIGQAVDKEAFKEIDKERTVKVDGFSFATSKKGVFAGGDVVSGPSDIVGAVAAGKEAAISIDRYLHGADVREDRIINFRLVNGAPLEKSAKKGIVATLDEKLALAEARRCVNCGVCEAGLDNGMQPACASACPAHALYYHDMWVLTPKKVMYKL